MYQVPDTWYRGLWYRALYILAQKYVNYRGLAKTSALVVPHLQVTHLGGKFLENFVVALQSISPLSTAKKQATSRVKL